MPVSIQGHDSAPSNVVAASGSVSKAGGKGGCLAEVAPEADGDEPGVRCMQGAQAGKATVAAAVVHEDDLVIQRQAGEGSVDLVAQWAQVFFLIVNGNDETERSYFALALRRFCRHHSRRFYHGVHWLPIREGGARPTLGRQPDYRDSVVQPVN